MKNTELEFTLLLMLLFSLSSLSSLPKIIEIRPDFHDIQVGIEYPISNKTESSEILAICEQQPWSLSNCQRKTLHGRKTITFRDLKMATSYQIGFVVNGKLQSSVLAATRSFRILAITCQTQRTQVLVETGPFFGGIISLEPLKTQNKKKIKCDMQGDTNSRQTQYLFTIHHDSCIGVYSNKSSVHATLVVQESWPILTSSTKRFKISCDFLRTNVTIASSMPKSKTMHKENENSSVRNFKRQTLQIHHGVASTNKENRKHEPKNPISPKSVFSGTLENKLKKPRVQSRTNNETQSWFEIGRNETYPTSHIILMVICVISAIIGLLATTLWIRSLLQSRMQEPDLCPGNTSHTEDKLVSTAEKPTSPSYENIEFSFDSTPKCLSESNSSFV